jgi:hypothetical protein
MPNRILFLVSAVLVNLALPVLPNVAYAADDCLASPNKATPAGGHWRYHLERGTGRKCWYLAGETATDDAAKPDADDPDTTASVAPKPPTKIAPSLERAAAAPPDRPRAKPTPTPSPPAMLGQANDARAEFIDTPRSDQPAASTPAVSDTPSAATPDAATPQQGSVGTRWPSPGSVPTVDSNSPPPMNSAPAPSAQPAATAPQPAADQPAPAVPADQATPSAQQGDPAEGPDYLLYALMIFASSFAVVVAFASLRFLTDWWRDWREETRWRQSEQTYAGYRERSMLAMDEVPMGLAAADDAPLPRRRARRAQVSEEVWEEIPEEPPRRLEDEIDEIEQLLALTRQTLAPTQPSMWQTHSPRDAAE